MKKILFLFMVMVLGAFTSPLFAIDSIEVGCATSKSQAVKDIEFTKSTPSDATFVKVNIWHKDTLMYSWGEDLDNRINGTSGGYSQDIDLTNVLAAVVCHLRGETGV